MNNVNIRMTAKHFTYSFLSKYLITNSFDGFLLLFVNGTTKELRTEKFYLMKPNLK